MATLFRLYLHGLLNAFSTLQKVMFLNWKTYFLEFGNHDKIIYKHNGNEPEFCGNHFWRPFGLSKTIVCWLRFPTFVTLSFVTEKVTFSKFRNFKQKYHGKPMKMNRNSETNVIRPAFSFVFTWFAERVPTLQKVTFSNWETCFSEFRNRVQQTM